MKFRLHLGLALALLHAHAVAGAPLSKKFDQIRTIVVIYAENRSFDNLYGQFSGANGVAGAQMPLQRDRDGRVPPAGLDRQQQHGRRALPIVLAQPSLRDRCAAHQQQARGQVRQMDICEPTRTLYVGCGHTIHNAHQPPKAPATPTPAAPDGS